MHDTRHWAASLIVSAFLCFCVPQRFPSQTLSQKSTPEGLQLLRKMQTALGGVEKIAAIRDMKKQ